MTESEALTLLRQYLPADQLPAVLETLAYPVPRDPHNWLLPDLECHLQVKVPWHFQVEADSPGGG